MNLNSAKNTDAQPLTSQERGELIPAMKSYALAGFLQAGIGTKEEFEKLWRQAFCADEALEVREK